MKTSNEQSGFALLLAIVVASIVLAIGLTMLNLTVKQLTLSSVVRESEISFQAATAAMECIRYSRLKNPDGYINTLSGNVAPAIDCLSSATVNINSQSVQFSSGTNYINAFKYQLDWGTGNDERCSEIDLYTMVADSDFNYDFANAGISVAAGTLGDKSCSAGNVCTLAITRGYNRACSDLSGSLLTVEREITAQF